MLLKTTNAILLVSCALLSFFIGRVSVMNRPDAMSREFVFLDNAMMDSKIAKIDESIGFGLSVSDREGIEDSLSRTLTFPGVVKSISFFPYKEDPLVLSVYSSDSIFYMIRDAKGKWRVFKYVHFSI